VDSRIFSSLLFAPAIGLWSAALFQPALKAPAGSGSFQYTGLNCLLLGWLGIFGRLEWVLPWSANVLYWISLFSALFRRQPGRQALVLSLVAIPLALVTFVNRTIEMDEAGNKTAVVPGLGFYLWLGSMVLLAGALFVRLERPL
jgi:hypothetical protein